MKETNAVIETREMGEEELEELLQQEEETQEESEQETELAAQSDSVSRNEVVPEFSYVVRFKKPYEFNGQEIGQVDMSGLEELTTLDAQTIDREVAALNHHPRTKFKDTLYCKHVAMRVTGLPADFFNMLRWKDMNEIVSAVTWYFLFG